MWYWEFNAGSYYTTCFEVEITGETDTESDDDDRIDSESVSFDDYLIHIPLFYVGADYSETTLLSGANTIELDDDQVTFNFVVVSEEGIHTTYVYVLH